VFWFALVALLVLAAGPAAGAQWRWELGAETRLFLREPANPEQHGNNLSAYFQAELFFDFDQGRQAIVVAPFLRLDQGDRERRHADLREMYWRYRFPQADLYVGLRRVFWGVTETLHLVDIINQTDLVENTDTEDKLGQPMVQLSVARDWGTWDLFFMPLFRERTFPGSRGRLQTPWIGGTSDAVFESRRGKRQPDWALRYSHSIGPLELGLAHFAGTGREPLPLPRLDHTSGATGFVAFYEQIDQTSIDLAAVTGGWLWKLEALSRRGQLGRFNAFTGGVEYTLVGLGASLLDFGMIIEFQYDQRGNSLAAFQNDLTLGGRLAFNDAEGTELLVLGSVDRDGGGGIVSVEASRRLGNNLRLSLEGRWFRADQPRDLLYLFRRDDYLQLQISRYF
jgi:hypothetical protein